MIKFENRFDEYCYRVASFPLDNSVTTLEEGQWVTLKGGKVVLATGADKKAFIAMGSKRPGRDQVSGKMIAKVSFLVGSFMLTVSSFDKTGTYTADMTPLVVNSDSVLTPATGGSGEVVVAYAIGQPKNGYLRIVSA